jgi:hypothetical protein
MHRATILKHKFVNFIPKDIKEGVLYISLEYKTAVHKCVCGCGKEVVTPLLPTDWKLYNHGSTVSLDPSIGNWNFECKSHYFIKRNQVVWCRQWSKGRIEAGRTRDANNKKRYYGKPTINQPIPTPSRPSQGTPSGGFWEKLLEFFGLGR